MFSKHYQSELTYLRELGREFADAHPEIGGMLSERGGDPDVERLLEGFAFLTARIRERIDDAVPELVGHLGRLLLPHYFRPLPAATIVELTPKPGLLRGLHRVARGAEMGARPIRGVACRFRTTWDADLLPLTLLGAERDGTEREPIIRLRFRVPERAMGAVFEPGALRLYLHGPLAQAATLQLWLMRYLTRVTYRGQDGGARRADGLRIAPIPAEQQLFPWPARTPDGTRALQAYFALPESMLFCDLHGLEQLAEHASPDFSIELHFAEPPPLPERLASETFKLHCVPVVNLFETSAVPLHNDPSVNEHLLRAERLELGQFEVFELHSVTGLRARGGGRVRYAPFFDFAHDLPAASTASASSGGASSRGFYALRNAPSPRDSRGFDTYISLFSEDGQVADVDETVTVSMTCTNGALPADLRAGDISRVVQGSPDVAQFSNISAVAPSTSMLAGQEAHWRLLAHLAGSYRSLADPSALRAMLSLYNLQALAQQDRGRANRLRIEAVKNVGVAGTRRLIDSVPARGFSTEVRVDPAGFVSEGDAFLFGCALDTLLGARIPLNTFNQLSLVLEGRDITLAWPPRDGIQPIV